MQNRQLQTLLGEDGFARFLDDWQQQIELRDTLKNKPDKIVEYERMLRQATFAYSKADAASGRGKHSAARKLMAISDTQFERLTEYLSGEICGRADLESWLDRDVHYDVSNAPSLCPEAFPCVVTSRSLRNEGGGLLNVKRTKRQVKIDAVESALAELEQGSVDMDEMTKSIALKAKRLRKLAAD